MCSAANVITDNPTIRRQSFKLNRELIMSTAAKLFAETSYEAVSLDQVAAKIGATKGLIYHYFPSKSALLGEMLLWQHNQFLEDVSDAWALENISPKEKLERIIKAHLDFNFKNALTLTVIYRTSYLVPAEKRRKIRRIRQTYTKKFQQLVEEAQAAGSLIKGDASVMTTSIIILLNSLPFFYRDAREPESKKIYELILNSFFAK